MDLAFEINYPRLELAGPVKTIPDIETPSHWVGHPRRSGPVHPTHWSMTEFKVETALTSTKIRERTPECK